MKEKLFDTSKLVVYAELLTKMTEGIQLFGQQVFKNHEWGGIQTPERDIIFKQLSTQQDLVETRRILIVKELTKRIKRDTGLNRGPGDLDAMFNSIIENNPVLRLGEGEIKAAILKGKADLKIVSDKEKDNPKPKAKKSVSKKRYIHRSAKTGKLVTEEYALSNPDTTVRELVKQ